MNSQTRLHPEVGRLACVIPPLSHKLAPAAAGIGAQNLVLMPSAESEDDHNLTLHVVVLQQLSSRKHQHAIRSFYTSVVTSLQDRKTD
jgi:hypothetical protein